MDPITTAIVAALAAGATKAADSVGKNLVTDAYEGLKALLKRKFGAHSEVVKAIEGVEAKPDSTGRKETLKEEIATSKADQDQEVIAAAQKLLEQLTALPDGAQHIQHAVGNYIAQADRGGTASVRVNRPSE